MGSDGLHGNPGGELGQAFVVRFANSRLRGIVNSGDAAGARFFEMGRYDDYKRRVLQISQRLSADGYFGSKSGSAGNVSMLVEGEHAVVVTPTRLAVST